MSRQNYFKLKIQSTILQDYKQNSRKIRTLSFASQILRKRKFKLNCHRFSKSTGNLEKSSLFHRVYSRLKKNESFKLHWKKKAKSNFVILCRKINKIAKTRFSVTLWINSSHKCCISSHKFDWNFAVKFTKFKCMHHCAPKFKILKNL